MPRYVVDVHYDGTPYAGWQLQENVVTVQGEVEQAISLLLKETISVYGAGRTDAGVHALQMPAHFDFEGVLPTNFLHSVNAILPREVAITRAYAAPTPDFHARFSAKWRTYRYQIVFRKDPHRYGRAYWLKFPVDLEPMQRGAAILMEYDSFESLCKAHGNNKTYFCKITESHWQREGDLLVYHVKADRFLRGMVRAIVGTLLMMGNGKLDEAGLRTILEAKDRRLAGSSVPPCGLFLTGVGY